MDWQHLIMNGENLAEYAALLAAEGLLGHQHANSGWGTFDDDNMVGATAFMETLELARRAAPRGLRRRRRAARASTSTRTPRTRSRRSSARCCSGASSTGRRADRRRRAARGAGAQGRGARLRARLRGARGAGGVSVAVGLDVGTTGGQGARGLARTARCVGARRGRVRAVDAAAGLGRAGPRGLVARRPRRRWRGLGVDEVAGIGLSGQMHGLVALDAGEQVLRPAILWNDQRTGAECDGDRGADRARRG